MKYSKRLPYYFILLTIFFFGCNKKSNRLNDLKLMKLKGDVIGLIEKHSWEDNPMSFIENYYLFNENGNIEKSLMLDENGNLYNTGVYKYKFKDDKIIEENISSKNYHNGSTESKVTFNYENEKLISDSSFNLDGSQSRNSHYFYDMNGLITKVSYILEYKDKDGKKIKSTSEERFFYNEKKEITRINSYSRDLDTKEKRTYFLKNDIVFKEKNKYGSVIYYKYTFDSVGNWIKKTNTLTREIVIRKIYYKKDDLSVFMKKFNDVETGKLKLKKNN
jgi:hypothetical protein